MTQEITTSTYKISEIRGDVWLHHEQNEKLTPGKEYSISLGDLLITAPLAEATVELSSTNQIHVGNSDKEIFVFDHAVQDQIYDITEVAIDVSSIASIAEYSLVDALAYDINLNTLFNQADFSLLSGNEDSALSYQTINQHRSHLTPTVEIHDVISDFNPVNDRFVIPYPGSIAEGSGGFTEAQIKNNSSQYDIALHKIDSHGYMSFKDSQGRDISLTDSAMLNPVVNYLAQNFNGKVGDTLMFKIGNDSYIFHFHPEVYAQQFGLIKFEGLIFDGMSQNYDGHHGNYLYVDFS
jgi:hypothetical protein